MPEFYVYLAASLPALQFGAKPPFSFAHFLEICQDKIPAADLEVLCSASIDGEYAYRGSQETLKKWQAFDTGLRNELARIRAERKKIDPLKYQRKSEFIEPYFTRAALSAVRNASILEAEKALDQERWRALEDLSVGHYFDLDFLVVYAQKLLILERWEHIRSAEKAGLLKEAITLH